MARIVTYRNLEYAGRLGNQLWQVAWQFGEADRLGARPVINSDWSYRPFLSVPDEYFEYPLEHVTDVVDGETNYFQELPYWINIEDKIRQYFQPKDGLSFRKEYCSLHVRRGDYLKYPHLFPPPTARYYHDAVDDVLDRVPSASFLVFSDDIEWCKGNVDYLGLTSKDATFVDPVVTPVEVVDRGEPKDQLDLFAMMGCGEHILSNSTFSWWGAWLSSNRSPYMPSVWFGPQVPGYATHKLAFPDSWRRIEC